MYVNAFVQSSSNRSKRADNSSQFVDVAEIFFLFSPEFKLNQSKCQSPLYLANAAGLLTCTCTGVVLGVLVCNKTGMGFEDQDRCLHPFFLSNQQKKKPPGPARI